MALLQNGIQHNLREWAPLADLFSKLPLKNQTGLFYQEIKLTCIDVLPEFMALGTNVGMVYWFDRHKKDMQRLRCENNIPITALKVISTVDYMVACGNAVGNISIFQIPKSHPDNLPENLRPKNKQVERYTVAGLHKIAISAIDWSKNGMKLFSGDRNGCVVLTEIDFYMHICKSVEILNEAYEVVQLSYNQQRLLVSTIYRSIICQKLDKWKVAQIGTKDRKVLGNFGGIIYQHSEKPSDTRLYCIRPGLRMWVSDIEGNVQKTLLFKELLIKECPEVPLINPISSNLKKLKPQKEPAFGILLPFNEKLLVTYNNDVVYILDPQEMIILYTVSQLRGVIHVATHKDEIFILEEERSLVRISFRPESIVGNAFSSTKDSFLPLSSLKDLTMKLQTASVISAIPPIFDNATNHDLNIHTDEMLIMNAEEARESPTRSGIVGHDIQRKFEEIGKKEFEDNILYKKNKHRKKRSSMNASTLSLSSNSSEEKELNFTKPTIMNLSTVGVLPDLRSPESIKYDIEYKEKILADVLSLDKIKISNMGNSSEVNNSENSDCDDKTDIASTNRQNNSNHCDKNLVFAVTKIDTCHNEIERDSSSKIDVKHPLKILDEKQKILNETLTQLALKESKPSTRILDEIIDYTKEDRETPACMNIPNTWGLSNIHMLDRTMSMKSDESLSDWEFV